MSYPIEARDRMRVALRADVALPSVERYLATDDPMRPSTVRRIECALSDLGLAHLVRAKRAA